MARINTVNVNGVDYDVRYYAHKYVIGRQGYTNSFVAFEIICNKSELVSTYEELYELCKGRHIQGYAEDSDACFSGKGITSMMSGILYIQEDQVLGFGIGSNSNSEIIDAFYGLDIVDGIVIFKENDESRPSQYSTITPL
jgi:hypothetical protein